jgi:hypothetical protein
VSFGPYISPEYIDKTLPPCSPVKKGGVAKPVEGTPRSAVVDATPTSLLKKTLKRTLNKNQVRCFLNLLAISCGQICAI